MCEKVWIVMKAARYIYVRNNTDKIHYYDLMAYFARKYASKTHKLAQTLS